MISNASDLLLPIEVVSKRLGLTVGVLNPHQRNPSVVLQRDANFLPPDASGPTQLQSIPCDSHRRATDVHQANKLGGAISTERRFYAILSMVSRS